MTRTFRVTLLAGALLAPVSLRAQTPGLTAYDASSNGWSQSAAPLCLSFCGIPIGFGYVFHTSLIGQVVTGLSFFNPTWAGGSNTLGPVNASTNGLADSFDVSLWAINWDPVTGTYVAPGGANPGLGSVTISASTAQPVMVAGAVTGAFWTAMLAAPISLQPNQHYFVWSSTTGGGTPQMAGPSGSAPQMDPRILFDDYALGGLYPAFGTCSGCLGSFASRTNPATGASIVLAPASSATPEPETVMLLGSGLLGLGGWRRRRRSLMTS